jgi:hypothetical protein
MSNARARLVDTLAAALAEARGGEVEAEDVADAIHVLRGIAIADRPLGQHGGARIKGQKQGGDATLIGRGRTYWIERLRRDGFSDLVRQVRAHERSARGAAAEAYGNRRRPRRLTPAPEAPPAASAEFDVTSMIA